MFEQSAIEKIKTKKIYALEGNIGAGKTTILKIIGKHVEFVE
jgi:tRNA A37 threonylcarbamoyladenosine biosynthesis protein TsaE